MISVLMNVQNVEVGYTTRPQITTQRGISKVSILVSVVLV